MTPQRKSPDNLTISTVTSNSSMDIDLRRVRSMPEQVETVVSTSSDDALRRSQSEGGRIALQVDLYGFIQNMDKHGFVTQPQAEVDVQKNQTNALEKKRTDKWKTMLGSWDHFSRRRKKLVLKRLRKGAPHGIRGQIWTTMCGVPEQIKKNPGLYEKYAVSSATPSKAFQSIHETIERDIHRTFPRHSMFYDDGDADELGSNSSPVQMSNELSGSFFEDQREDIPRHMVEGQASLQRVLKAYSLHDQDVGYCQGMNFITGMFLTIMTEEEAFWMLVTVMSKSPCSMRGLFGEGMSETHKVLHVAEHLVNQFLPKLAKHLEKEHIHVTMYATQWLLTQFTSSFNFDLVLRVWDAFLFEGWKITYRVMLSILKEFESTLLQMSFEEILGFMRDLPDRIPDGGKIVDAAIKIPLRKKQVTRLENEWRSAQGPQQ